MEVQSVAEPPIPQGPRNDGPPPPKRPKNPNASAQRRHLRLSDIVYTKGATIQTMASLTKQLRGATEPVIGLMYVWEYRSPSKAVPPHYQCKMCNVSRLQHDMIAHVKGWKHSFRYLKQFRADQVTWQEEEAVKDPAIRKKIKEMAAEVERTGGRGQIKVILKEPSEVIAFKGFRTAIPKPPPPIGPGPGFGGPNPGGLFLDPMFADGFPRHGGPLPTFPPMNGPGGLGGGGLLSSPPHPRPGRDFPEANMGPRRFSDGTGPREEGRLGGGRDGFGGGGGGLLGDGDWRRPEEFRGAPTERPNERPGLMGAAPESSNLPSTLMKYLDSFRIENESDAQIVLKVTQKLTDALMDYRLRSVSWGSSSLSMPSTSVSSSPSGPGRDRFPGSSRYSDGPSRFYH